jgi:hypothetical protein
MERLGSDQPELRAALAVPQVIDWLAPVLQRYLTGRLD